MIIRHLHDIRRRQGTTHVLLLLNLLHLLDLVYRLLLLHLLDTLLLLQRIERAH